MRSNVMRGHAAAWYFGPRVSGSGRHVHFHLLRSIFALDALAASTVERAEPRERACARTTGAATEAAEALAARFGGGAPRSTAASRRATASALLASMRALCSAVSVDAGGAAAAVAAVADAAATAADAGAAIGAATSGRIACVAGVAEEAGGGIDEATGVGKNDRRVGDANGLLMEAASRFGAAAGAAAGVERMVATAGDDVPALLPCSADHD